MQTYIRLGITLLFILNTCLPAWSQVARQGLMPMPAEVKFGNGALPIDKGFSISVEGNFNKRILSESTRFLRRLDHKTACFFTQDQVTGTQANAQLNISISRPGKVVLGEDESYTLEVGTSGVRLVANTDIGAIRGLETLLQLVHPGSQGFQLPEVKISDSPRFPWRGIMLDVARHYMPMEVIYRNLDAMAATKLNVLHLHLSDDQGFRIETSSFPTLTELGSDGLYYTKQDLKNIIAHADQRGIRVVPEIDVPGHATAILTAFPHLGSKDTTYSLERFSGIFDPTLDPTNEETYQFLEKLILEVAAIFPDAYFHIGGDENMGKHWDANPKIQSFMKGRNIANNHELQAYFNIRLQKMLEKQGKLTMGWEEIMVPQLPTTALIHSWRGDMERVEPKKSLFDAANAGYNTILSNGYYLDLMYSAGDHYLVDPAPSSAALSSEARQRILGGEMCMWSELVVPETIDSRLWPRGAAIAERFWSPETVNDVEDMYHRLEVVSLQLEQLGLQHISSSEIILRKMTGGKDCGPIQELLELVEPMKGYSRNVEGTMYATYSPFRLWADAATPDAKKAREFNQGALAYIQGNKSGRKLVLQLKKWSLNHSEALPIIESSPLLWEIKDLSANLSLIAEVGLEAMKYHEAKVVPDANWLSQSKKRIENAKMQGGRTELQIILGISLLIDHVATQAK